MAFEYGRTATIPAKMIPQAGPLAARRQQDLQDEQRERARSEKEERAATARRERSHEQTAAGAVMEELARQRELSEASGAEVQPDETISKASVRGFKSGFTGNVVSALSPTAQTLRAGGDLIGEAVAIQRGVDTVTTTPPSAVVAQNHARFPELAAVALATGAVERFPELGSDDLSLPSPLADVAEDLTR